MGHLRKLIREKLKRQNRSEGKYRLKKLRKCVKEQKSVRVEGEIVNPNEAETILEMYSTISPRQASRFLSLPIRMLVEKKIDNDIRESILNAKINENRNDIQIGSVVRFIKSPDNNRISRGDEAIVMDDSRQLDWEVLLKKEVESGGGEIAVEESEITSTGKVLSDKQIDALYRGFKTWE